MKALFRLYLVVWKRMTGEQAATMNLRSWSFVISLVVLAQSLVVLDHPDLDASNTDVDQFYR